MSDRYDLIEARFLNDAMPVLGRYVELECLSPDFDPDWAEHGAIDAAVELLAAWASARRLEGAEVRMARLEGRSPALIVEVPAFRGGTGSALLYGHLDKQPPLGSWSDGLGPFTPVRRGDLLFGRGTGDDGYSLFSALLALESLQAAGNPHPRCMVLIEASEESGSPDLEAHLDALGSELAEVDLVVCLDSGALSYDRLWVTTSLRGCVVLSLEVAVLEHGVHSGEASGVVPSSFRLARQLLDRIEDPVTGELLLPELRVQIPEHHLAAAASLARELSDPLSTHFPTVPGLELMGRDGAERLVRQAWSAALSVTGADGIPSVAEGGNVLRASTTLKLSVRIPPSVDAAVAQRALIAALVTEPPAGATVKVVAGEPAQGWVAPSPARWLAAALDEASLEAFGRATSFLGEGGSIPFLSSLGTRFPAAQFVVTGVLGPGSNAHGPDESLHLPCCFGVTTAVAGVLAALGREPRPSATRAAGAHR
jgi:acetylornithine deacetylase/succinyl-diaminopimelate desuccinylase-like protein